MATFNAIANKLASDLQRDFGLTKEQAIGFVGNLAMESAGFQTLQEIDPAVPGSRGGYGYAQWTGPRRKQFEAYAKANGLSVDSYEANYGFLKKELNGSHSDALRLLKKADTVAAAGQVARKSYLIPGVENIAARNGWTQRVLDGYAYVPPGDLGTDSLSRLENIHDRQASAQGYGEIPPIPAMRPGYPPIPLPRREAPAVSAPPSLDMLPMPPLSAPRAPVAGLRLPQVPASNAPARDAIPAIRAAIAAAPQTTVPSVATRDPIGSGASLSDLRTFSPPQVTHTAGLAGSAQLPPGVTPQIPAIVRTTPQIPATVRPPPVPPPTSKTVMVPNPAYIPPKGSVVTPTGGTVSQSQMDAIRGVGADAYQKPAPSVPQYIPKTVAVPPIPRPYAEGLSARANAIPATPTVPQAFENWWNGTLLGSGINALTGKKPEQEPTGGGMLGGLLSLIPRREIAQNIARRAQEDPLGFEIGQANRRATGPTYDVSGGNNSFNPVSVQNSSRWQTGY